MRPPALPFFGRFFDYVADPVALMRDLYDTQGPVATTTVLGRRTVFLLGPDACEEALRNGDKAFANQPAWSRIVGPFFERGLMLLDFAEHHAHRRIMQEAFTRDRLAGYADQMPDAVARGLTAWPEGAEVRVYPALKQLTLDIAVEVFMGGAEHSEPSEIDRVNAAFVDCVQAAAGIVRADVPFTRWGRAFRGRRVVEDFLRGHLPARRAARTPDLFSVLCHVETDDGHRFDDDDVIAHMVFVMMAAHDTSTTTVAAMMQYLGQHPVWQERCREEALGLPDRPALTDLDTMTSVDVVMREALRLRAPVPVLVRRCVRDTTVCGVPIPAGTDCVVGVQLSHLMPEYWTDPTAFDPDRFAEERREDRSHRYAWEPFGGGVHKCIGLHFAGLEIKAILHRLLREWEWEVPADYVAPIDYHSLPFPKDGLPVALRRRATDRADHALAE